MNNKNILFILICLFLANAVYAGKDEVVSPEALISRARLLEDIWAEGTPSMLMRADVQTLDAIRDANGYWQKSGLSYQPEIIFHLDALIHVKNLLRVGSKQTLGKVKNRRKNGVREQCTDVKWSSQTERTLCFDEGTGALLSAYRI